MADTNDANRISGSAGGITVDWPEKRLPPADQLVLEPDDAHLWQVSLAASAESLRELAGTLSADEQSRAASFRFDARRRRFVIGRGVLRALLGRYLDRAPAGLEFVYGPNGKPSLARPPNARPIFFNLSQSEDIALIAITWTGEIGIDLEHLRAIPEWPEIAQRILARDRDAAAPKTLMEFLYEWTRHEARVKAAGAGLGGQPTGESRWTVRSLSLGDEWAAAVAFPTGVRHFTGWKWGEGVAPGS